MSFYLYSISSPKLSKIGPVCVEFYYHMYGNTMGTLQMTRNETTLWAKAGEQQRAQRYDWIKAAITVNMADEQENVGIHSIL